MINFTIAWLTIPLALGFVVFLLPKIDRFLAIISSLLSLVYGLLLFRQTTPINLTLLDSFGVILTLDNLSAYFILTNSIVTTAVIIYCWQSDKNSYFFGQAIILHGSLNAAFATADFMSLYVALEVVGIGAFSLIAYPRNEKSLWIALRYLFMSNVSMLFYLVGTILVYKANHSFAFQGLNNSPPEALVLIFIGLLVKAGIFISGFWLPLTHSESETPVSALLSGVVVKASILALIRCAQIHEEIDFIVRIFGMATAIMGVSYAVLEKDAKRMLAFHTISQLGFILASPAVGGFYALSHGLVKSCLFLGVGNLPTRDLKELKHKTIDTSLWLILLIASLSISGFPLLSGFSAKILTLKSLLSWQIIPMNIVAVGTAISFSKLIFIPHENKIKVIPSSVKFATYLLIIALFLTNFIYFKAYDFPNITKSLLTIAIGWTIYKLIIQKLAIKVSRYWEKFDHLVGFMTLTSVLIFVIIFSLNNSLFSMI